MTRMDRSRRMRSLLGDEMADDDPWKPATIDTWGLPEPSQNLSSNPNSFEKLSVNEHLDNEVFSGSEDDKKILNAEYTVGGRFAQPPGRNQLVERDFDISPYQSRLKFGEEVAIAETFCHLRSLIRYPYDHMSKADRTKIAKKYFEKGELYARAWDFFYIYPPGELGNKPFLLIPTIQVQQFLHHINLEHGTYCKFPDFEAFPSFSTTFDMEGAPRPRYLGHAIEREMAEGLKLSMPSASWRPPGENTVPRHVSDCSFEAFKNKIESLMEIDKKKKATVKARKTAERHRKQQGFGQQIKRVERYLGLRESKIGQDAAIKKSLDSSGLEWGAYDDAAQAAKAQALVPKPFSLKDPAPYMPEDAVVFICIDVEAYERDHSKITEIGFAILDTTDLQSLPPGPGGQNWIEAIRGTHIRIDEYKHLLNRDFVQGCPDKFQFGESKFIKNNELDKEIAKCFRPPYTRPNGSLDEPKRQIVLVGHDLGLDVKFLKAVGYDVHNLSNLQEEIDTSSMYRALHRETNPRNLGSCLAELGLTGWWLHNAGNDAVYTLQAMVAIALKDMAERQAEGDEAAIEQKALEKRLKVEVKVKEAEENALVDQQGWSSDEADDGGAPVPIGGSVNAQLKQPIINKDQGGGTGHGVRQKW